MGDLLDTLWSPFANLAVPIFLSPIALAPWWLISAVMVQLSVRYTSETGSARIGALVRRLARINIGAVAAGGFCGITQSLAWLALPDSAFGGLFFFGGELAWLTAIVTHVLTVGMIVARPHALARTHGRWLKRWAWIAPSAGLGLLVLTDALFLVVYARLNS